MTIQTKESAVLPLHGAVNFRDMGGLETADGRRVKKGLFFRAAELTDLTEKDKLYLKSLKIARIFDYRTQFEANHKPDPMIGDAINERVSVNDEKKERMVTSMKQLFESGQFKSFDEDTLLNVYTNLPVGNPAYQHLMDLLKKPEANLPLIHHCTAGRDRTGIGAMLILLTLDVPLETVMEDYLLSNETLEEYHQQIFERAAEILAEKELDAFRKMFLLQERYLLASYENIIKHYGNFETYLEKEHKITPLFRASIQEYCLEK
ncbi:protein-tyrosine-phosphatase [Pueribacillus theae]|uniref:Protein-tyrosine-phosphatase n=1 Tax=Pueribacillus theae TaxID=2171751 RepID=A0A2U1JYX1_9BACI|nr:tyrosine-protein phosphatase [Pueribacillus theae]PWA10342.1 protein-tyrosine-phosphatase [Pueribacillus theae]